jgi:pimeloyl-ACP methyl ester carboxylesterase
MNEVVVDGLRVAYSEAGAGPPLVLLHGGMDDSRSWRWQLEGLADRFRLLAWDAPGCGRSSDPPERWRMHDYADCLATWLHTIGIDRAHVLGLSWGSSIAIELSRRHPTVPASLVLASAYLGWAGTLPSEEVAARVEHLLSAPAPSHEALLEEAGSFLANTTSSALVDELVSIWADNTAAQHPSGFRAAVRSMAEADLRDVPPTIQVPTLVVHGALDQRSPLATARELHEAIPSSKLVVIPTAGHLVNAETPNEFNHHVSDFIGSLEL